ncbi:rhomboid family intramembrane serine protease [Methylococcus sp. ANG]|uniref:rhomboid family intramembrane serine protease n=1 Tax=Methylococcus sp. ANG TaxID=3231903 RepID=UPI00345907DD
MFPLRDINPALRRPIAVLLILLINVGAWAIVQGLGQDQPLAQSLCEYALIPGELLRLAPVGTIIPVSQNFGCQLDGDASAWTLVTHMFLHGGWFHIIGNMWFLWVFGDNVEDVMGPVRFVGFYVLCGLAAAAAQIASDPTAAVPMVGASGAIGGVMGAYARLYPRTQVITLIFLGFYWTTVAVPAFAMLGYWFFIQLISGLPALGGASGGVAFWAHVGGFLAGLLLVGPMHRPDYLAQHARFAARRYFDSGPV